MSNIQTGNFGVANSSQNKLHDPLNLLQKLQAVYLPELKSLFQDCIWLRSKLGLENKQVLQTSESRLLQFVTIVEAVIKQIEELTDDDATKDDGKMLISLEGKIIKAILPVKARLVERLQQTQQDEKVEKSTTGFGFLNSEKEPDNLSEPIPPDKKDSGSNNLVLAPPSNLIVHNNPPAISNNSMPKINGLIINPSAQINPSTSNRSNSYHHFSAIQSAIQSEQEKKLSESKRNNTNRRNTNPTQPVHQIPNTIKIIPQNMFSAAYFANQMAGSTGAPVILNNPAALQQLQYPQISSLSIPGGSGSTSSTSTMSYNNPMPDSRMRNGMNYVELSIPMPQNSMQYKPNSVIPSTSNEPNLNSIQQSTTFAELNKNGKNKKSKKGTKDDDQRSTGNKMGNQSSVNTNVLNVRSVEDILLDDEKKLNAVNGLTLIKNEDKNAQYPVQASHFPRTSNIANLQYLNRYPHLGSSHTYSVINSLQPTIVAGPGVARPMVSTKIPQEQQISANLTSEKSHSIATPAVLNLQVYPNQPLEVNNISASNPTSLVNKKREDLGSSSDDNSGYTTNSTESTSANNSSLKLLSKTTTDGMKDTTAIKTNSILDSVPHSIQSQEYTIAKTPAISNSNVINTIVVSDDDEDEVQHLVTQPSKSASATINANVKIKQEMTVDEKESSLDKQFSSSNINFHGGQSLMAWNPNEPFNKQQQDFSYKQDAFATVKKEVMESKPVVISNHASPEQKLKRASPSVPVTTPSNKNRKKVGVNKSSNIQPSVTEIKNEPSEKLGGLPKSKRSYSDFCTLIQDDSDNMRTKTFPPIPYVTEKSSNINNKISRSNSSESHTSQDNVRLDKSEHNQPPITVSHSTSSLALNMSASLILNNMVDSNNKEGDEYLMSPRRRRKLNQIVPNPRKPRSADYNCSVCNEPYQCVVVENPWWAVYLHECPHCKSMQIPRLDINAASNAIELDPNVVALYGEGMEDSGDEGDCRYEFTEEEEDDDDAVDSLSESKKLFHMKEEASDSVSQNAKPDEQSFDGEGLLNKDEASKLLVLMCHARTCSGVHSSEKHLEICRSTKFLMLHIRDCRGADIVSGRECQFPWCVPCKKMIRHLTQCYEPDTCSVCNPWSLPESFQQLRKLNQIQFCQPAQDIL